MTSLEMRQRPPLRPMPTAPLRLVRWQRPPPARYRALFRRVGAPWLWFSRLAIADTALKRIIHDPGVHVFAVEDRAGIEIGLLELDFRIADECELGFLGLVPELAGKGHGRWLMAEALARAWAAGIQRVWVHTCTLDHPAALGFYRREGFAVFARAIERFADPRALGILDADAAPQVARIAASQTARIAPARER